MADGPEPSVAEILRELRKGLESIGEDFQESFAKLQEDAQYRFDKEFAKQLAKHPELYAELKRGFRQVRKGIDKAVKEWGLK